MYVDETLIRTSYTKKNNENAGGDKKAIMSGASGLGGIFQTAESHKTTSETQHHVGRTIFL